MAAHDVERVRIAHAMGLSADAGLDLSFPVRPVAGREEFAPGWGTRDRVRAAVPRLLARYECPPSQRFAPRDISFFFSERTGDGKAISVEYDAAGRVQQVTVFHDSGVVPGAECCRRF